MATGQPLFPGVSTHDQLTRIFRLLGAPSDEDYPEMSELPNFRTVSPLIFLEDSLVLLERNPR